MGLSLSEPGIFFFNLSHRVRYRFGVNPFAKVPYFIFFFALLLLLHGPFFLLSWRGPSICWWITSVCLYFELVSSSLCGSIACKFPSSRPGLRSCRLIIEDISSFPPLSVSGKNSRRGSDILVWCRAKPRIRCALDASASMAYVFHHLSSKSGDRLKKTSFFFFPRPLLFRFPFSYRRCCKITRSIH